MVNIDRQVEAAAKLVRQGDYFCISRGRQYGKTTTLAALKKKLEAEGFVVFSLSFEGLGDTEFSSLESLLGASLQLMSFCAECGAVNNLSKASAELLEANDSSLRVVSSIQYRRLIAQLAISDNVVLMIDEVDQAGNYPEFIKFLGLLREMYLSRDSAPTFQSIILAGVYDVKNLRLKIRTEQDHQYNSPWNIAVPFDVNMSLPAEGIAGMLADYKTEHSIEFDNAAVGRMIYDYTSGYPFLVSRICQIMDQQSYSWDKDGVLKAVNAILKEENTLFDDLVKKLQQFPELKKLMRQILYCGVKQAFSAYEHNLQLARRFNFIIEEDGMVKISCRLFETFLYNLFLAEEKAELMFRTGTMEKSQFVQDGIIDMKRLLERFCVHFNDIFRTEDGSMDYEFVEKQGRKQFLLYLKPIINGVGNYYVESETRDETRTDIIVDYLGHQYIIELKIWHGNAYNERGEKQLSEYLDLYHIQTGYMVSFCFNKGKTPGVSEIMIGDRRIIEAIV